MDEFWVAKILDFGLAKLLMPYQMRTLTLIRGTRGYIEPEWYKRTPISVKEDVYSYGIVLLETICCKKNMEIDASKPEEIILTYWVYKCFINRQLNKLVCGTEVDKKNLENLVKVGLWCVQDEPALRPSMKCVVMPSWVKSCSGFLKLYCSMSKYKCHALHTRPAKLCMNTFTFAMTGCFKF